jgi:hypothetical protein
VNPPENDREWLRRRAAEIRAEQAGQQLSGIADEVRAALALHDAKLTAIDQLMADTVAAAGLTPPEPGPPRLRLIRGGTEI